MIAIALIAYCGPYTDLTDNLLSAHHKECKMMFASSHLSISMFFIFPLFSFVVLKTKQNKKHYSCHRDSALPTSSI